MKNNRNNEIKIINSQLVLIKELAKGDTLNNIAISLNIKYYNLQKRTQNLYKKFAVNNRKELIYKALKENVITTKDISKKFRKRFLKNLDSINLPKSEKYFLSSQEVIYLILKSQGFTEVEIREIMGLKGKYHSFCIANSILMKLDVKNFVQALVKYYNMGNI